MSVLHDLGTLGHGPVQAPGATSHEGPDPALAGGRLQRVQAIEHSVGEAKVALWQAEDALQSVYAGLALEPLEQPPQVSMAADPPSPPAAADAGFVIHSEALQRRLHWSAVPLWVQAVALLLLGAYISLALEPLLGRERALALRIFMRETLGQLAGTVKTEAPRPASVPAAAAPVSPAVTAPAATEMAVVIYDRTSPYPGRLPAISPKERHCLAEAIYYEARGEPIAEQIAVAQVVLNRVLAGGTWPSSVCDVVTQGSENGEKCQFSYACQRSLLSSPGGEPWVQAKGLAEEILAGGAWLEEMLDATHFHRVDLKPVWRLTLLEAGRFGQHVFYVSPTENRRPLSRQAGR